MPPQHHTSAAELDRLRHGGCPPTVRRQVAALIDTRPVATEPDSLSRDHQDHRALRRLAQALPPAAEVFADTDLLAALSATTALAHPWLYQAFLSHYILCVGSVATLAGRPSSPPAPGPEAGRAGAEPPPPGSAELAQVQAKGVFMVTEIGDASSHLGTRTTAEYDEAADEFVLHTPDARAAKFSSVGAPGRGLPQQAVVIARLVVRGEDRGVFSFLTPISGEDGRPVPGVALSSPIAVDAVPLPYALIRFDRLRLPRGAWLHDSARIRPDGTFHDPLGSHDARLQRTLSVGQTLWATAPTAMAAMASRAAVLTLRYCEQRRSHGRLAPGASVLRYRTQQHAVLGALAEAFALTCAAAEARRAWAGGPAGPAVSGEQGDQAPAEMTFSPWAAVDRSLAVHKALSARATAALIAECQHRCGLAGFHRQNRLQGYHDLARAFENAGGDSTLILLDAGRALVTDLPTESASAGASAGSGAAAPVRYSDLPVTDPLWWPGLARGLEHRLTQEVRTAHDLRAKSTPDAFELWNGLLAQTLELGESHSHRLAAESVAGALASLTDPGLQEPLRLLAGLYGIRQARRHSGLLLRTGLLEAEEVRELPAALDTLCDALAPHLPLLTTVLDPADPPTLPPTTPPPAGQAAAAPVIPMTAPDFATALTAALTWHRGAR
ncbi:Acyl-CoA oxidase [Kitasatospora sp. MMS16-BH015]|uniref:acyl-CoA dehydrogenase family protein n=1 Tax=Kitasatospora sp. MMS16-BH015 TaxID=2018025 RepID=UPI000CA26C9C|nr:acyl-CoA dehydrogenase [Kitasatospora sp. MMS16-BH015]AUG75083.1 Acyl-CoA oxidase [Kitasatospora sp. MMS16-BH015]